MSSDKHRPGEHKFNLVINHVTGRRRCECGAEAIPYGPSMHIVKKAGEKELKQ